MNSINSTEKYYGTKNTKALVIIIIRHYYLNKENKNLCKKQIPL